MRFVITKRFADAYRTLPDGLKKKADKALRLLAENPAHPSLHLKKMQRVRGIWEARVDISCRITLEIHSTHYLLRNIGKHDETLSSP